MESRRKQWNISAFFTNAHPVTKLFLVLFGMLSIFLIVTFLGTLVALPIFGLSLGEMNELLQNNFRNAENSFIKYFQSIQSLGLFVIPGLLFWYVFFDDLGHTDNRTGRINTLTGFLILLTIISLVPLIGLLVVWNGDFQFPSGMSDLETTLQHLENDAAQLTERILSGTSYSDLLLNLLIIAVLPAIGEEFIFRGILQNLLMKWIKKPFLAIFIAGIVFSAFHLQFYGFLPRLFLGMYFGYIFYWSRNIWYAVWAHFLNNALAVGLFFLSVKNIELFPSYFNDESISIVHLVSGTSLSIGFVWLTRMIVRQKSRRSDE